MEYRDSYEQAEGDLNLHLAAMVERMEWENTLPANEKSKRRLIKYIQQLPSSAEAAAKYGLPWIMLGCIERIVHHAETAFGPTWMDDVRRERRAFFESDDE